MAPTLLSSFPLPATCTLSWSWGAQDGPESPSPHFPAASGADDSGDHFQEATVATTTSAPTHLEDGERPMGAGVEKRGSPWPGLAGTSPFSSTPSQCPTAGFLRLVNGSHRCEGRVEMFYLSQWGTVCDDAWDLRDAEVVCRQLGCGSAVAAWGEAHYGPGTGYIFLDNLKCKGSEPALLRCSHIRWDVHNCDHSEDASAVCSLL